MVANPATSEAKIRNPASRTPHSATRAPSEVSGAAASQGMPRS